MKNLVALLCFFVSSLCLNAQINPTDKGVILLKGSSNLNISLTDGTPIRLGAGGAYFFFDNIPIGADISFTSFDGNSNVTVEPFARYYLKEEFFAGARLVKTTNSEGGDSLGLGLEGGYVWYLNDYVAIEPTLKLPLEKGSSISIEVSFSIYY